MGLKGRKPLGELPDPWMAARRRKAWMLRLLDVLDDRIRRAERRGAPARRVARLKERRVMARDEVARMDDVLRALENHGTPYQFRVPGTKERVRLYRRKKRR